MINGFDSLAVTNLDGLDGVADLKICVGYRLAGRRMKAPPADDSVLRRCQPIYLTMPGWQSATVTARSLASLPLEARSYLQAIAKLAEAPIRLVSVGPGREQTLRTLVRP